MLLVCVPEWSCTNCRTRGLAWWRTWFRNCTESHRTGMNRKFGRIVKFIWQQRLEQELQKTDISCKICHIYAILHLCWHLIKTESSIRCELISLLLVIGTCIYIQSPGRSPCLPGRNFTQAKHGNSWYELPQKILQGGQCKGHHPCPE